MPAPSTSPITKKSSIGPEIARFSPTGAGSADSAATPGATLPVAAAARWRSSGMAPFWWWRHPRHQGFSAPRGWFCPDGGRHVRPYGRPMSTRMPSTVHHAVPDQLRGFPAVTHTLDSSGVDYEVVRHDPTGSALADARAYGAAPRRVAKTLAVRCGERLVVVAIPASSQLQMQRVRHLLDDPDARLVSEAELSRELPGLEAGALPPFGPPAPPLVLVDRRLLASSWVLANGGDHRHSLRVSPLQIVRLSQARVVDIADTVLC